MDQSVCCSAPGKVLITGGFLVLDQLYDGIVFTVNSRFYSNIESLKTLNDLENDLSYFGTIKVNSPQFKSSQEYKVHRVNNTYKLEPINDSSSIYRENKYVENTIIYSLILIESLSPINNIKNKLSQGLLITIVGDNGFYSQIPQLKERSLPLSFDSLKQLPNYLPVSGSPTLGEIQKTGLGSSAALVASLTSSLLSYFSVVDIENNPLDKEILHNLAQICHCIAQGKIGSGFDISSAIFGSQVYKRFSPNIIQKIFNLYDKKLYPSSEELLAIVKGSGLNDTKWDNKHIDMALPPGFKLILADISMGSNTPVLVRKVLEWRKENPIESLQLWTDLNNNNNQVKDCLNEIHKIYKTCNKSSYKEVLEIISNLNHSEWSLPPLQKEEIDYQLLFKLLKVLNKIRESFLEIRRLMRKMGSKADVPLEPIEQTDLANKTMEVEGCIAAGVPGAGGYDALFAIIIDNEKTFKTLTTTWSYYENCKVLPLLLEEEPIGIKFDKIKNNNNI